MRRSSWSSGACCAVLRAGRAQAVRSTSRDRLQALWSCIVYGGLGGGAVSILVGEALEAVPVAELEDPEESLLED